MVTFLVLFFPAALSLWIWEKATKCTLPKRKWVYLYALNTLLINFLCFVLKKWVLHTGEYTIEGMTPNSAINYMLVAVVLAAVVALVEVFCYKRVRLQVESGEEKENGEKEQ